MSDRRPERVYGVIIRDGRVFLASYAGQLGPPGGEFRPLAEDRKVELRAHIYDQLGIEARAVWAQGAFDYEHPADTEPHFSGFYSIWDFQGAIRDGAGEWLDAESVSRAPLDPSLRILLMSLLNTEAIRTT